MGNQLDDRSAGFARDGYSIVEEVLSGEETRQLREAIAAIPDGVEVRRKRGVYGIRNLLEVCPAVAQLAGSPQLRKFVAPILGDRCFAVRAVFFDKSPGANWALGWHQDSVISVRERVADERFIGWSNKAGVLQVQPPPEILSNMVAVRVHLDDSHEQNGPLRVIPATHNLGWLDDEIDQWKQRGPQITCTVGEGGLILMSPMTLHASSDSASDDHRRVIHIEYAADDLPSGLQWNNRIGAGASAGSDATS